MTLSDYLADRAITETAFAEIVGVDQSTINRAKRGKVPTPDVMKVIFQKTNGAVTPNDFVGVAA